jgi:adenosylcobinamide hydrolase
VAASELTTFPDGCGPALACLVWRLSEPMLVASTASVGGGIGMRDWVVNVQVPPSYGRRDIEAHVGEIAQLLRLPGTGVGMLTAAQIARVAVFQDEPGVRVEVTGSPSLPIWAAAPESANEAEAATARPGTINVVAFVPVRHSDAALANLLCTVTEAKVQALADGRIPGTGTASDAVTVLCPASGPVEPFGGPRSIWGARVARAVYAAVRAGMESTTSLRGLSAAPGRPDQAAVASGIAASLRIAGRDQAATAKIPADRPAVH